MFKLLRRFCKEEIFSAAKVRSFGSVREEEVEAMTNSIRNASGAREAVNLSEMLICVFNNVTFREMFGRKSISTAGHDDQEIVRGISEVLSGFSLGEFFPSLWWLDLLTGWRWKLERIFRGMDRVFEQEIEQRMKGGGMADEPQDFLEVLLRRQIPRNEAKALLMDIVLGGINSSAVIIEWGMVELMRNSDAMKKAQEEVRKLVGCKEKVDENDIQHLRYLKLVINETLRLHPPGTINDRQCLKDTMINGYNIPEGSRVIVNNWAISRDPQYWDDPDTFRPERFENISINYRGNHFEFIPFGSGRRMCPEMAFGVLGVELVFANILISFNWDLSEGIERNDINMGEQFGLVTCKKEPLILVPTPVNAFM